MNKFLVFAGPKYYPYGGWDDFISAHATLPEAEEAARASVGPLSDNDWWHIVDLTTMAEIKASLDKTNFVTSHKP